jgi:hypothetical protein
LSLTTVIPQIYIYFVREFPHPEVKPVMGYEENKDDDEKSPFFHGCENGLFLLITPTMNY